MHSEDCVAKGSPLMQRVLTSRANEANVLKPTRRHGEPERNFIEGFVIAESEMNGHWESVWDRSVSSFTMIEPVRPDDEMLNASLHDGTIVGQYRSNYMKGGLAYGEPKFYHEVGCAMAHRKAWQTFIDRNNNGGG